MSASIQGLHHVTATVDAPQPDLDFCVEALDLRLVKKTVNFDHHHVCHFYYGNEHVRSIYFREPVRVLFEVATIPPGFLIDEPLDVLGRELQLPPWEEVHRGEIVSGLAPVTLPAPGPMRGLPVA